MLSNEYFVDPILTKRIVGLEQQIRGLLKQKHQIQSNWMLKPQIKTQLLKLNENNLIEVRKCLQKCKLSMVEYWDQQQIHITKKSIQKATKNKSQQQKDKVKININNQQNQNSFISILNKSKQSILNRTKQSYQTNYTKRITSTTSNSNHYKSNFIQSDNSNSNQQYSSLILNNSNNLIQNNNKNDISFEVNEFNLTLKSNNNLVEKQSSQLQLRSYEEMNKSKQNKSKQLISDILRREKDFVFKNGKTKSDYNGQLNKNCQENLSKNIDSNNGRKMRMKGKTHYNRAKHIPFHFKLMKQINKKNIIIKSLVDYISDLQTDLGLTQLQHHHKRIISSNQFNNSHKNISMDELHKQSSRWSQSLNDNDNLSQTQYYQQFSMKDSLNSSSLSYPNNVTIIAHEQQISELQELVELYKQKAQKLQHKLNLQETEISELKKENQRLSQYKLNSHSHQQCTKNLLTHLNQIKQLSKTLECIKTQNETLKMQRAYLLKKVNINFN